jgi:WD40 repeat protein/serine/threonine protein kinase
MAQQGKDIKLIFAEALEKQTGEERAAYLDGICGKDVDLLRKVEALLTAYEKASDVPDSPIIDLGPTMEDTSFSEEPGTIIGRYKVLEKIGEGGMAVVYMAEQKHPIRRRVALKIIKLGMDTKSVIARFEGERQALAMMDHPNVAKILDAGATDTGRPYFVMDLVPGLPITQYCDKNRLSIEDRLALFISVCNAVQHAHQKGIIHRDIKPSNILVTQHDGKPIPKVIDFGIAKAINQKLTEKTLFTRHAHMIGTPAYMSPEQAELSDLDVDTRTDIYSLGILLYELLTCTTPFGEEQLREAGYLQMQKIICETEPTKPSTKLSTLGEALTDVAKWHNCSPESMPKLTRGDLDWIVMKSLEKDRTRRYETASALAMDVQRHLNNEPVQAAAPSISYKARKFIKRHRISAIAGIIVAVSLFVVALISMMYAREVTLRAEESENARQEITGLLAGSYVDQAQTLCEQGHIGRGMLWLARSLRIAPPGDDLDGAIRTSLAAWRHQLHSLTTVVQYPDKINRVTFSPDGARILVACQDGTASFCDSATGEMIGRPLNHGSLIWDAAISPDGTRIATWGKDRLVRLWDASTMEQVAEPIQHQVCWRIMFSHDNARLITAGKDGFRSWDARTGEPADNTVRCENQGVRDVVCCPDGVRAVLTVGRDTYQMFDVKRGEPIGPSVNPGRMAFAVAISPDGKRFITGDGAGTIRVWNAASGEQVQEPMMHGGTTYTLAFSPDGSRIISGGASRMARLWNASTGTPIGGPMRQRNTVTTVAFSPDGTRIVTGNDGGVVQQWDLAVDGHVGKTVQSEGRICGATFGQNDLWILTQIDDMVQFRDATTDEPIGKPFTFSEEIRFRALSPDSSRLAIWSSEDPLSLWDVATGELVGKLSHQGARCVVFSPDGSRILTGGNDNIARLWDATTLECLAEFHQHQGVVIDVAFSPDGCRFLTGSYDGTTRMWDARTLEPIGEPLIHHSEVKGLAFSPDGTKILIGFADGTVRLYDAITLKPIGTPLQHVMLVCSVAMSSDGSQLLACSIDGTARLWDAATLKPIGPPLDHHCNWPRASFSPDGSQILVADVHGNVQVWRAPQGPLQGSCERIVCWVQVVTGMELDSAGGIHVLDVGTWNQRRQRLQELGGPPLRNPTDFDPRNKRKGL